MAKTQKHEDVDGYTVETIGDVPEMVARIVAVALSRQIKGFRGVTVGLTYTVVHLKKESVRYRTPLGFDQAIETFKRTGEFELGEYRLDPVGDAFDDE